MTSETQAVVAPPVIYPESDGQPMADNTRQFEWIVTIKENLEAWYREHPDVFVAGDLLWYPVKGESTICRAPDTMVVFGRSKGHRGSYLQWLEDDIPPQVVFEVLSPGNTRRELAEKFEFYDLHGVEEYYIYDPDANHLNGWLRRGGRLRVIDSMQGWISPRMGIRFALTADDLHLYDPKGKRFLTFVELVQQRDHALVQLDQERREKRVLAQQRDQERREKVELRQQRDHALTQLERERERTRRLEERLREMGIDMENV